MHRYVCIDCNLVKRASNRKRGRCRKCLNENLPGDGNRPNRKKKK